MKPFVFAFALVFAALTASAQAAGFTVPPTPDHHVVDPNGALSSAARTSLENELTHYESATGHQIVVWIGQTTGDVPLETWTTQTADTWKLGRKGHDDGAVLFAFMKDHKVRIEVGYGLEGKLPDADAYRIINDTIVPKMKAGDVDAAIVGGALAMIHTISPDYAPTSASPPPDDSSNMSPAVAILILIIFAIVALFAVVFIVARIIGAIRYGYLVMREGPKAASNAMAGWWFWGALGSGGGGGWSSGGGSSFDGGGFSAGGGSFGGGGASGSW